MQSSKLSPKISALEYVPFLLFNKQYIYSPYHHRVSPSCSPVSSLSESTLTSSDTQGAHQQVPEGQQFDLKDTPDLKGKVAVITGGSEGIGYGASHTLLSHGLEKLFILSLSKEVVDKSINAIKEEMGEETAKKVTWLECDLSDWKKVKQTADKIASSTDRIDILINNAARGIMTYQLTDYGVDRHVRLILLSSWTMC